MGPPEKFNPSKIEAKADNHWSSNDISKKVKESRKGGRNYYLTRYPNLIDDEIKWSDIYRNILSDVWARFQSMRNYNVKSSLGLDPLNYFLENNILQKNRAEKLKDITDVDSSLDEMIERFEKRSKKEFSKYGLWYVDKDIYSTDDKEFLDSIWWTFKEIYQNNLVEKRKEPVLWCPECNIPISGIEVELKEDVIEKAIIKVPTKKGKNRFLLVEVTNSWTIPSSPSLIVNPNKEYSVVKYQKDGNLEQAVMLDEKVEKIMEKGNVQKYRVTNTIFGSKLEGLSYTYPLMNKVPYHNELESENVHKVITSDKIDTEGTGIFFFIPSHDKDHWKIALEKNIDPYTPVEYTGKYDSDLRKTKYSGFPAANSDSMILNDLESQNNIFFRIVEDDKLKHCTYCSNKVLPMPKEELFFKSSNLEDDIKKDFDEIHWIPRKEHFKGKNLDDLEIKDWFISRDSEIGVPVPIWKCKCGNRFIPEDRVDLSNLSEYNKKEYPYSFIIDDLEIECEECGRNMNRINKVFNPLFTSSASPWAQLNYPQDQYGYQSWWPAKLLFSQTSPDYTDIFKANISLSKPLFDENSVESMFIHGKIETEFEKLPSDKLKEIGYDSLRLKLLSDKPPWDNRKIKEEDINKTNKLIRVFWNIYRYIDESIKNNDFKPNDVTLEYLQQHMTPEDEWLLSRLESVKKEMKNSFIDSRVDKAISVLEKFIIKDIGQWYISVARARIKNEEEKNKQSLMKVLYDTVLTISKLSTPLIPHTSEMIYQDLKGQEESVFMNKWPTTNKLLKKEEIENEMNVIKKMIDEIIDYKRQSDLPLKWPLKRIIVDCQEEGYSDLIIKYAHILINKGKTKDIDLVEAGEEWYEMNLKANPNKNAIGQTYQQWESRIAILLRQRPPEEIRIGIENGEYTIGIEGQIVEITPDMVTFETELPEGFHELNFDGFKVYLDLEITDEVWEDQMAKEIILRLKSMKQEFTLEENDEVEVYVDGSDETIRAIESNEEKIKKEIGIRNLHLKDEEMEGAEYVLEWDIHNESVYLGMTPLYKSNVLEIFNLIPGMDEETAEKLYDSGYTSLDLLEKASASDLSDISGIKRSLARRIVHVVQEEKEDLVQVGEEMEEEVTVEEQRVKMKEPHRGPQTEKEPEEEIEELKAEMPEGITKSSTYLIFKDSSDKSFKLFKEVIETGMQGLCVTRDYPEKIKKKYRLENVSMIWLSNVDRKDVIRPKNLEKFSLKLEKFLTERGGIILFNGLEYLITNNEFRTVLHLIQSIKDQVAINESILMIPINPTTLEEHQMDLLESEVDEVLDNS
ncbi:MAG: DUF835 domain-containing protein [Thermoplasmata archaeon]